MKIIDFDPTDEETIHQAAHLLIKSFREHWPNAWPNIEAALAEVREALRDDHINRLAVDDAGQVLGWIGGMPQYNGHTWELHPLAVRPDQQGRGVGQALVADFEAQVRARGGLTIYLGSDDEAGLTTLANTDLYPNVLEHLAHIENLRGHPYSFYQKQGYTIVGVIPDANGRGKPDIIMAKRVGA